MFGISAFQGGLLLYFLYKIIQKTGFLM